MAIKIVNQASSINTSYFPGRSIKYIVIHYTAGASSAAGSARNTALYFGNPSAGGSADFVVDDSTIVQFSPDILNYFCWHAGVDYSNGKAPFWGKCTNANSIAIEICSTNRNYSSKDPANSSKWSFTDAAVEKAIELTKYLMQKYNIPVSNVIRHWDVCRKPCPGILGWNTYNGSTEEKWLAFKKKLDTSNAINSSATTSSTIYRVRKSANDVKSQVGAFTVLANAKKQADKSGLNVYDGVGKLVYSSKSKTTTTKKSNTEIAREVIAGKWGNGSDRKKRLEAAGYDYSVIQNEVNKIMR